MLEPLGGQPINLQTNQKSRKGCLIGVIIGLLIVSSMIGIFGIIGGALLLGNKFTVEYECAMSEVKKNPEVINLLGEPIEAGFFAYGERSDKNSQRVSHFTTSITGPKGSGTLYVKSFRNPVGSSFQMLVEKDGQTMTIYNGVYPCS